MSGQKKMPRGKPFQKGHSGNPGGRPKLPWSIVELARDNTPSAMHTLIEIHEDKNAPPSARVAAAEAVLDRGWGRPTQVVDATVRDTNSQKYELTDDQLAEIAVTTLADKTASTH